MAHPAAGPPASAAVDWDDWRHSLQRFAAATGLTVSAYDASAELHVGPLPTGGVAAMIARRDGWSDTGMALAIERALVARVVSTGLAEELSVCGELQLRAMPIATGDTVHAVIVFGWVFRSFTTSLACQRIGRELGIGGSELWAEARLESPVPASRFSVYADLLQTLVAAASRHAAALDRLAELDRLREVFLAGVSHELRTPLSALGMRIDVLLRDALDDPDALRASLARMKQHVSTQARLVEDLLDAARTRTGQLSVQRVPLSIAAVLQAALAAVLPHADEKPVQLLAPAFGPLAALEVEGDFHRLQQVFSNLLSNAVKFTPKHGRVELRVVDDGAWVEVIVADSGVGIDRALLPLVFDAFTRRHLDNAHGLGLGLSIARSIVELHGGSIRVESEGPDLGATFHVRLPKLT